MYVTYWNPPRTRQITFDEILSGVVNVNQLKYGGDETSTRTVQREGLNDRLVAITNVTSMITQLTEFNQKYARLEAVHDLSTITTTLKSLRKLVDFDRLMPQQTN